MVSSILISPFGRFHHGMADATGVGAGGESALAKVLIYYKYGQRSIDQGRNKGGTIPRAPNHYGCAEKSQQCYRYFLQYSTFASERPQVRTWGTKLASGPGRHITSLRPWYRHVLTIQYCINEIIPLCY